MAAAATTEVAPLLIEILYLIDISHPLHDIRGILNRDRDREVFVIYLRYIFENWKGKNDFMSILNFIKLINSIYHTNSNMQIPLHHTVGPGTRYTYEVLHSKLNDAIIYLESMTNIDKIIVFNKLMEDPTGIHNPRESTFRSVHIHYMKFRGAEE